MPQMDETILKSRRFLLVARDGRRLDVTACLKQLGRQAPYFSVTSRGQGANHDEILSVEPGLSHLVEMHLTDRRGWPRSAVQNLAHYLSGEEYEAALSHIRHKVPIEDLMLLRGRASMARKATEESVRREVTRTHEDVLEKLRAMEAKGIVRGSRRYREMEAELDAGSTQEKRDASVAIAGRRAFVDAVSEFVNGRLAPVWEEMAERALRDLDGPTVVAAGWVEPEDDPTTFVGFAKAHGLHLAVGTPGKADKNWSKTDSGATKWGCTLSSSVGSMDFPFTKGSGYKRLPPTLDEVLESLHLDVASSDLTFDDWCSEFGYDTDSRQAEATHAACVRIRIGLERVLGADGLAYFLSKVGEDMPILGGEDTSDTPAPTI